MPATTKARAPRAKAVTNAVEAKPVRKPRAKKATPAMAAIAHEKVFLPKVARQLSGGFMDFARKLEAATESVLSFKTAALIMESIIAKQGGARRHSGNTALHRRAGSRAHRNWARRRASGLAA